MRTTRCNISCQRSTSTLVLARSYRGLKLQMLRSVPQTRPLQPFWAECGCTFPSRRISCFRGECGSLSGYMWSAFSSARLTTASSVWRPIVDIVQDQPLTFCDARTIEPSDLVEADHVRKHYNGSNYYAKPNHKYRWHYLSRQRKEEVTLLKMFDSDPEVEAKC